MEKGFASLEKKDYPTAVIHLRKAVQEDPTLYEARLALGRILLDTGFAPAAEREIMEAKAHGAPRPKWLPLFAEANLLQKRPEMVVKVLREESGGEPQYASDVAIYLGQALLQQRDPAAARAEFERALGLVPDNLKALLGLAAVELGAGNPDGALRYVLRVLAIDEANFDAWLLKGNADNTRKAYAEALAAFEKAQSLRPDNPLPIFGRASTLIATERLDEAQKILEKQMTRSGEVSVGVYQLATIEWRREHLDKAKELLERALRLDPDSELSHLLLGTLLVRKENPQAAITHLKKYLDKNPDAAAPRKILASAYFQVGAMDEAAALLEDSVKRGEKDPQVLAMLGTVYLRQKNIDRGIELLERAVDQDPANQAAQGELASALIASGRGGDAVERLESIVSFGEESVDIDLLRILALMKTRDYDNALSRAVEFREKSPNQALGWVMEGVVLVAMDRHDEARTRFANALREDPAFHTAELNLASLDMLEGAMDSAKTRYENITRQDPKNLAAFLGLARIAKEKGEKPLMAVYLQKARAADPKAVAPRVALIDYLLEIGENLEAVVVARELVEQHPESLDSAQTLGLTLMKSGDLEAATGVFRRMTELAPEAPEAYGLLAEAEYAGKRFATARAALDKALELNPNSWTVLAVKGNIAGQTGRLEEALGIGRQLQSMEPGRPEGYILEADSLRELGRLEEAVDRLQSGMAKAPNAEGAAKLHTVLRLLGKKKEALQTLTDWIEGEPDDVTARQLLTSAYLEDHRYAEALPHLMKLDELIPDDLTVINNLAWLYTYLGDSRALTYGAKAYEINPGNPEVLDTYGWAMIQLGKSAEGLDLLREAATDAPNRLEIRYHFAVGLYKNGLYSEAKQELEKILRIGKEFASHSSAVALVEDLSRRGF
ncbi:MAG: PEP-CTERM system TPR-repeat protein PrsT [Chromatiales bacterium]|nr:PEP-CTERM system TPR-repeat protein PrsT [Chromatiales bacterium]